MYGDVVVRLGRLSGNHSGIAEVLHTKAVLFAYNVGDPVAGLTVVVNQLGPDGIDGRNLLKVVRLEVDAFEAFLRIAVDPGYLWKRCLSSRRYRCGPFYFF